MYGGVVSRHHQAVLHIPTSCPTIQLNSDTISQVNVTVLQDSSLPSTSGANCKLRLSSALQNWLPIRGSHSPVLRLTIPVASPGCYLVTSTSDPLAVNQGFP